MSCAPPSFFRSYHPMNPLQHSLGTPVLSVALMGLDAHLTHIEASAVPSAPSFTITGLPEAQARESRVRVRAALQQIGVDIHHHTVAVQVSPTELANHAGLDAAIALAVLAALEQHPWTRSGTR